MGKWISVDERLPSIFVSVLGHMEGMEPFPTVRECYLVHSGQFYFPALSACHKITHWMDMPKPPKKR